MINNRLFGLAVTARRAAVKKPDEPLIRARGWLKGLVPSKLSCALALSLNPFFGKNSQAVLHHLFSFREV